VKRAASFLGCDAGMRFMDHAFVSRIFFLGGSFFNAKFGNRKKAGN
jgi:hypothetical protein